MPPVGLWLPASSPGCVSKALIKYPVGAGYEVLLNIVSREVGPGQGHCVGAFSWCTTDLAIVGFSEVFFASNYRVLV